MKLNVTKKYFDMDNKEIPAPTIGKVPIKYCLIFVSVSGNVSGKPQEVKCEYLGLGRIKVLWVPIGNPVILKEEPTVCRFVYLRFTVIGTPIVLVETLDFSSVVPLDPSGPQPEK